MKYNLVLMLFLFATPVIADQIVGHVSTELRTSVLMDVPQRMDTMPRIMDFSVIDPIPLAKKPHDPASFKIDFGDGTSGVLNEDLVSCDTHCAARFIIKHAYSNYGKYIAIFYKNNLRISSITFDVNG